MKALAVRAGSWVLRVVAVGVVSTHSAFGADPVPETPGAVEPEEPPAEAPPAEEPSLAQAKRLFRDGNELRHAGDFQRALELYLKSRELVPSVPNTMNAAYCLDQLGRSDEALQMYEDLLREFGSSLGDGDRATVRTAMGRLQTRVGRLDVSSNTTGTLVVSGRTRGELPLPGPVRVMPGKHIVRVIKDGWETFETTVTVKLGEPAHVDARLKRLTRAGRLRIESAELPEAELFIDGAKVGKLPWEGTLAPGEHLYWVRLGDSGSAPKIATVVEGQTVLASLKVAKLGPDFGVVVDPPTADLWIDGVKVGRGTWAGALPVGRHTLTAREVGYFDESLTLSSVHKPAVRLKLRADPDHPRWGSAKQSVFWLEGFGGAAFGGSLGSGAEASCSSVTCSEDASAVGGMFGVRAGYEFSFGGAIELGAGYMTLSTSLAREVPDPDAGVPAIYTLEDRIRVAGPFALIGANYRMGLGSKFQLTGAVDVGAAFVSARDEITGTGAGGGRTVTVGLDRAGKTVGGAAVFVLPEIRADYLFDGFYVGLGLGAAVFVLDGPRNDHGDLVVTGVTGACTPGTVECAKNSTVVAGEEAYGRTALAEATLRVGRRF